MTGYRYWMQAAVAGGAMLAIAVPATAQIRTVDPSNPTARSAGTTGTASTAAAGNNQPETNYGAEVPVSAEPGDTADTSSATTHMATAPTATPATAGPAAGTGTPAASRPGVDGAIARQAEKPDPTQVYQDDDILSAAEGVFGRGAQGLAKTIESILKKQGRPNAYIAGREVGGSFVVGLRYGSGTLHHKIEGDRPVYWTGPSVGFDFGGSGAKTFVLVYNLYDSQDLFNRFPAVEGAAYLIGGFNVSYLRRKDVVLIPVRLGVGWRLGANIGYMKFTEHSKILPF